ncbi:MAG: Ig-like domain-containing protein [Deltaproteobacteria bacterium]|nr:Ig-like domain-containing protein [Deltaproteobacteria bacterium]
MRRHPVLWALWLCLSMACGLEPPSGDVVPPSVWQVSPSGDGVDPGCCVRVTFSEPVHPNVLAQQLVILAPGAAVDEAFLADFDRPPLSARRQGEIVACEMRFDLDGSQIALQPELSLDPNRLYAVVVSAAVCDLVGNPLVEEILDDERGRAVGEKCHVLHWFTTR